MQIRYTFLSGGSKDFMKAHGVLPRHEKKLDDVFLGDSKTFFFSHELLYVTTDSHNMYKTLLLKSQELVGFINSCAE